ncbi:MAG: hypothetical protein EZS28_026515 [Streblomastix strix]|uniref:Uncharacterized protein n=1 Tax=Streblomastix strix TaxID=222440 RepID=A0A5J4V562_9EUKA|nr:MAG: hypothetical protein EZS28_026515 [Streblomastix strix]
MQQDAAYVLDASIPTNAITQSPSFGLASMQQLFNKQPFGNRSDVTYDAVNVILSPQTIDYSSDPLDSKKFYCSNYELKSSFVIAFGTGTPIVRGIAFLKAVRQEILDLFYKRNFHEHRYFIQQDALKKQQDK